MAEYGVTSGNFTVELPSSPGCEIWGPTFLSWKMRTAINKASSTIERGEDGISREIFIPTSLQYHLVQQWILAPDSDWNLQVEGQKLTRSKDTIDDVLNPDDMSYLAYRLMQQFYPEMFESAEGEVAAPSEGSDRSEKPNSDATPKATRSSSVKTT